MSGTGADNTLTLRRLSVTLPDGSQPVRDVSLDVLAGQVHALVGHSGSGKSLTARAVVGLLPHGARAGGQADVCTQDGTPLRLVGPGPVRPERVRGGVVSYVPQQTATSLHPGRTLGAQARAVLRAHGRRDAWPQAAVRALHQVGLIGAGGGAGGARRFLRAYPHQLSGGQLQRAVLALSELCRPRVSIPDEITTGLDPRVRAGLLNHLRQRADAGRAVLLITHDLAVVERVADQVTVLREGEMVESGSVGRVLARPSRPFTRRLLADHPRHLRLDGPPDTVLDTDPDTAFSVAEQRPAAVQQPPQESAHERAPEEPATRACVLSARDLRVTYAPRRGGPPVTALDGVSLDLHAGEAVAVVGASGCGKSTLLACLAGLSQPDRGRLRWSASAAHTAGPPPVQLLFQDAASSFDPRLTVGRVVAAPLRYAPAADRLPEARQAARVAALLADVGLPAEVALARPAQLSGGQAQRVALARALAVGPEVLLCDEPTTNLDATAQAGVLRLLSRMRARHRLASVFVTHDMALVPHVADRVFVLHAGRIVECLPADGLDRAAHPVSRALYAAAH